MSYLPQTFYSTEDIERHSRCHTHFFDADSKRFFGSRIGQNAYSTANPFLTLFTTSEQFVPSYGRPDPRRYTIRCYDSRTHDVDTVGKFQEYASSAQANREAKRLAATIEYTLEDQHEYALLLNEEYDFQQHVALRRNDPSRLANFKRYNGINGLAQPQAIKSIQRYTDKEVADPWVLIGSDFIISASDDPSHPHGVWAATNVWAWEVVRTEYSDEIAWSSLPFTLQRHLVNFFKEE